MRYFYAGDRPTETFCASGRVVRPLYAKIRDLTYFGRVLVRERIVWLPATDEIRVFLDGRQMPIDLGQESDPIYAALPDPTWRRLTRHRRAPAPPTAEPTSDVPAPAAQVAPTRRRRPRSPLSKRLRRLRKRISRPTSALPRLRNALTRRAEPSNSAKAGPLDELNPSGDAELRARAKSDSVCARYRRAWTFLDRDTEAHDNAEHLYRWVLRHCPEINAWFVLRRESTDWDRLAGRASASSSSARPSTCCYCSTPITSSPLRWTTTSCVRWMRPASGRSHGASPSCSTASPRTTSPGGSTASRSAVSSPPRRPSTPRSPVITRPTPSPKRRPG